jgi:branched-chain amino acid transport system permease protein
MGFRSVFQLIISGLTIGCVYSLVGLAFALLIRATGILNFAQGELVMLGAFVGLSVLNQLQVPYLVAFIVATVVGGLFGILMERLMFGPMLRKRPPMTNLFIATLGLQVILQTVAILIWGADPKPYPQIGGEDPITVAGLLIRPQNLLILVLAVAIMALMQFFLKRTRLGIAWRAAALDPDTAALYGVNRRRNVALTFALSSALGAAGGVLVAPLFFASFGMGGSVQIKSFFAATIGTFSTVGTMLGGLAVGVVETLAAGLISSDYKNVILYGLSLCALFLFFRPDAPEGRTPDEAPRAASTGESLLSKERLGKWPRIALIGMALMVWVGFPLVAGRYAVHIVDLALIYAVAILGLQLVFGYTGMLSLGHAAFFGLGAYTYALLTMKLGLPLLITVPLAACVAGLGALIVAPTLRLSGIYLIVATAAFQEVAYLLMINLKSVTNGAYGLYGIAGPSIGPLEIDGDFAYYFFVSLVLGLTYIALRRITKSRVGRALIAVRENELSAVMSGVNAAGYRIQAFVVGAACAGVAGALYAPFVSYISPEAFTLSVSINMVTMAVIGGLGNLVGGVVGAMAIILAPEYLRFLGDYRLIVYGAIMIIFMMFFPGGVTGLLRQPLRVLVRQVQRLVGGTPPADGRSEATNS